MEETKHWLSQYVPLAIEGVEVETLAAIEKAINSVSDPVGRQLLRLRYLEPDEEKRYRPRRWQKVAIMFYGNDDPSIMRQVFRMHTKALQEIKEKGHP